MAHYYIGTSGWHYDDWKERFYPRGLAKSRWLEFFARQFSTVELNNTFYRLPSEETVTRWHESTPGGFTFSVKASRYITHIKRLRKVDEELETMFKRVGLLKEKLGPLLYQLPHSYERNDEVLDSFLSLLPSDRKHVLEFRHESWLKDKVFEILRRHQTGFCIFDQPDMPCPAVVTSSFGYVRFHGKKYSSSYTMQELASWAKKIVELATGLDSFFIYFNNDVRGYAVNNARTLREELSEKQVV